MPDIAPTLIPTREKAARWTADQVIDLARERQALGCRFEAMTREVEAMKHQLDWFRRQIFGQKSEKRLFDAPPQQMSLGELPVPESSPPPPAKEIAAHAPGAQLRLRRGGRAGPVLRRDAGARSDHQCAQSGDRRARAGSVRSDWPEDQPPPRPASGQLRHPQVRAPGDQAL